jgi:carbon-monoxide dehydrogenase iron sulfur subunit
MINSSFCKRDKETKHILPEDIVERLKNGNTEVLASRPEDDYVSPKVITIHPQKCNGCGLCEIACSLFHLEYIDTSLSRIRVIEWHSDDIFLPNCCQQCAEAPCMAVCPKDAIYWNDDWGRVMVDYDRCVSCGTCMAACPYAAIGFDEIRQMIFKCDLCDGNPQCVHFCEPGALTWDDADMLQAACIRKSAGLRRKY